jgi:hypothetical protein
LGSATAASAVAVDYAGADVDRSLPAGVGLERNTAQ